MNQKRFRHHKTFAKVEIEENLLSGGRWSAYKERQQLQAESTAEEDRAIREACRQLVESGYGADEVFMNGCWTYTQRSDGIALAENRRH